MKYIKIFTLLAVAVLLAGCSDDDLNSDSIFDTSSPERNEFDEWLQKNYTEPYNISFNYRYSDKETDNNYNLVPAQYDKAVAFAIMVRHIWLDAYAEAVGTDFIKKYSPRVMQLIGSGEYNSQGSIVLGTAEGGLKVTLFRVNAIDVDNPYIDQTNPFPDKEREPIDLNYWFFHTMHHEFCHILTQQKNYSTDFQTISVGKYQTIGWINVDDSEAPEMGFVSGYASSEYNEDFAEIYATYITHTEEAWQQLLNAAGDEGRAAILAKFEIVKDYFSSSWGINLEQLRDVVLRRSAEVSDLDLKNLN